MLISSCFNKNDMNQCDVSEDSTMQVFNGMYGIQPSEC